MLSQKILLFLQGLDGPGMLPSVQATQAPTNQPFASTALKTSEIEGNDAFFRLVMTREQPQVATRHSQPFGGLIQAS